MTWIPIVDRAFTAGEFADYCRTLKLAAWRPSFVVVHNTALPTKAQWHTPPGPAQRIQNLVHFYQSKDPPWHAGPHLFVSTDLIWAFTPLTCPGVHSPSWNHESWGVETVGDFETESFDAATEGNLVAALVALHNLGKLDPQTLKFHKEDPKTTHDCPGRNIVKADLIARVTASLTKGE